MIKPLARTVIACCCCLTIPLLGCRESATLSRSSPATPASVDRISGHERMRQQLAEIARRSDAENGFVGSAHATRLRSLMDDPAFVTQLSRQKRWELYYEAGRAELRLGNEDRAIELLEQALEWVPKDPPLLRKQNHFELGLAYLRHGETQNCCQLNTPDSCIVPIRGQGLHVRPQGSQRGSNTSLVFWSSRPSRMRKRKSCISTPPRVGC